MIIVLMGVAGSGKTTIGTLLAARLAWPFHDGDDLHPAANRAKMQAGIELTDEDRRPWLAAVRDLVQRSIERRENGVVACSALKRAYRALLIVDPAVVKLVYLEGSPALIAGRLARRQSHFFNPALLRSQFAALEAPDDAVVVDVSAPPAQLVASIIERLGL